LAFKQQLEKNTMIKRDDIWGIICQHDPSNPSYCDGGDSARATGMMAMTGSTGDQALLEQFEVEQGHLCRHPYQNIYCNVNNFTRDQLVQFFGGLGKAIQQNTTGYRSIELARRVFWAHARRGFFCQNTHDLKDNKKTWWKSRDPLPLSNIGQMIIVAKIYWLYWLLPVCFMWLLLDIVFASFFQNSKDENNQIVALCDVYGKYTLKLYCSLDRKWQDKLIEYWGITSGYFRYQPEIGDSIIKYVNERIGSH
jgi:hypothetical protein